MFALLSSAQARASAAQYMLDSSCTSVAFEVRTFGAARRGTVTGASGTIRLDEAAASGSLEVLFDARSLDAESVSLRRILRSASLLDVERYPEIAYRAQHIKLADGALHTVDGQLTLRGVTRPVVLTVTAARCPQLANAPASCRLTATATFRRSDFGMTKYRSLASDEVKLVVSAVALPREETVVRQGDSRGSSATAQCDVQRGLRLRHAPLAELHDAVSFEILDRAPVDSRERVGR